MPYFNIVAASSESTVVAEYTPSTARPDAYQSEAELESELIRLLCEQGYEYLPIRSEAELVANLRQKLGELNGYTLPIRSGGGFSASALPMPTTVL